MKMRFFTTHGGDVALAGYLLAAAPTAFIVFTLLYMVDAPSTRANRPLPPTYALVPTASRIGERRAAAKHVRRGKPSKQARIIAKKFFAYKKRHPKPPRRLTPLQKRMQSGDV